MRFRCGRLAPPRPAGAVLAREGFRVTAVAPRPWAAALRAALRPFAYGAAGLLGAGACAAALAGDINAKVTDNASLDELLVKIKAELTKLGPILDLEMCGSQRGRTAVERSSTADAQGLEPRHRVSGQPASSAAPSSAPKGTVDVAAIMDKLAGQSKEKLDWRHSIVDLMKLLALDSSLAARKTLAGELHYTGNTDDSATMNVWLHKQVMAKLAENGGKVPDELKH